MTDGVVLGISGWFTPHGELYQQEGRTIDEIAAADWMTLLAHADSIDFITRPEPQRPAPDARIFHLTITFGDQSRDLAVNDPFEAPELAMLIRLTRRAMRDRLVLTPDMLNEQQLEAIRTAVGRHRAGDDEEADQGT